MKEPRNVSGIYFFNIKPDGTKEPLCFEDLPKDQQERVVREMPRVGLESIALLLAEVLRKVCDECNIVRE